MIKYSIDANNNEIVRLTISLGIVATSVGIISIGNDIVSSTLLTIKIGTFLLAVLAFSYIMLTGIKLKYRKDDFRIFKKDILECVRTKSYNYAIGFYWYAFFGILYLIVTKLFGITAEDSRNFAINLSFYSSIVLSVVFMFIIYLRKKKFIKKD